MYIGEIMASNKVLLEIVARFAKAHPFLILINFLFMAFVPINEILLPYLYGKMINNITSPAALTTLVIILVVLAVVQLGYISRDKLNDKFIPLLESAIKTDIVDIILSNHQKVGNGSELTTGDIIFKLSKIPGTILYWFQYLNDYIIPYIVVFITALIYFSRYDIVTAITFFIFAAILFFTFYVSPRVCLDAAKKNERIFSSLHEHIEDIIHNIPSVFSAGMQKDEMKDLGEHAVQYQKTYSSTAKCTRQFKFLLVGVTLMFIAFFVYRSRDLVLNGKVSKEKFTTVFMVMTSLLASVFWIIDLMKNSALDMGLISNVTDLLTPSNIIGRSLVPYPAPDNVIGVRNLTYDYTTRNVFKNLDVDFELGKLTILTGPIGAGKTTLFKVLLGFIVPQQGDAYFMGTWYRNMGDLAVLRNKIGYVAQNPVLFNNTVMYNAKYGNKNVDDETVIRLLGKLGYDEAFAYRNVGKNGMNISGGQRQIVWCVRVLLKDPDVILMDEPTASLDPASKIIVMDIIKKMMVGKTLIVITHDKDLAKYADTVVSI
jgi:ABC-type bacteriocin/lantibiotic exporter with double-glycine peptidase domain